MTDLRQPDRIDEARPAVPHWGIRQEIKRGSTHLSMAPVEVSMVFGGCGGPTIVITQHEEELHLAPEAADALCDAIRAAAEWRDTHSEVVRAAHEFTRSELRASGSYRNATDEWRALLTACREDGGML